MLDRYNIHDIVLSFLVGCMACLSLASVNNADGEYLLYVFYLKCVSYLQVKYLAPGAERA